MADSSADRVHGMLIAQSALLHALIRTLSPTQLELLKHAHFEESEAASSHVLNSQASDALVDALRSQVLADAEYLKLLRS